MSNDRLMEVAVEVSPRASSGGDEALVLEDANEGTGLSWLDMMASGFAVYLVVGIRMCSE